MTKTETIARIIAFEYDLTEATWPQWVSLAERIIATMTNDKPT